MFDRDRGRERARDEGGDADAAVTHVGGGDLDLGDIVGHLVRDEDTVELGFGGGAGAVAVVQVDDRPREQPLRVDVRLSLPDWRSPLTSATRTAGQPVASSKYSGISSSGNDISLPYCSLGRLRDAHVVVERLRHLLHAVEADEERHREHDLRLLAFVLSGSGEPARKLKS